MAISIFRELKMGKETFLPVSVENNIFKMMWWCEPGGGVPSHIHPHMDEHFTVLEGEVEFTVNGKKLIKKPGDTLFIAKNVVHGIKNIGTTNIKMEVYYTPVADTVEMFKILFFLNQSNWLGKPFCKIFLYVSATWSEAFLFNPISICDAHNEWHIVSCRKVSGME